MPGRGIPQWLDVGYEYVVVRPLAAHQDEIATGIYQNAYIVRVIRQCVVQQEQLPAPTRAKLYLYHHRERNVVVDDYGKLSQWMF
jgi:hypothetical protein